MLIGGTELDRARLRSSVTIDGDTFEVVDELVYLGSFLTDVNNVSREIRRRIISGSRAYYGRSRKIHPCTKLIRPVVLYKHEAWTMLEEDLAIGVFEQKVLRKIFGEVQGNGGGGE